MTKVSILSKCGRAKATVEDSTVTYYAAAVSTTGEVSWKFKRQTTFTMPFHVMLDVAEAVVNTPVIHKGR